MSRRKWRGSASCRVVERYCPQCGEKVLFEDSGAVRRNARATKVHEYRVYRCARGHTWNWKTMR